MKPKKIDMIKKIENKTVSINPNISVIIININTAVKRQRFFFYSQGSLIKGRLTSPLYLTTLLHLFCQLPLSLPAPCLCSQVSVLGLLLFMSFLFSQADLIHSYGFMYNRFASEFQIWITNPNFPLPQLYILLPTRYLHLDMLQVSAGLKVILLLFPKTLPQTCFFSRMPFL